MTSNSFGVHFILKKDKVDRSGFVPIYAKISINNERIALSINRRVKLLDWITKDELAKPNSEDNKVTNEIISSFKSKIYTTYSALIASNVAHNAETFKKLYYGDNKKTKIPTLLEIAAQHNENFEQMIGIRYSQGSYKNYKTTLKYLFEFVPIYHSKKDISLKEVNYKFAEAYFTFLTTEKDCKQNGANKQIQRLKKVLNYAIKQGFMQTNPLASFSLEFTPVNKIALTMHELEKLQKLILVRQVLINVRNIFLFQCYTGLSYGDTQRLSIANIERKEKDEYWIKMNREKTKVAFSVPLLPQAISIIEKYLSPESIKSKLLPVLSNQKMNDNLKLIQELAGINKNLTTHLARHTFATTVTLGHGVPIETVSRMLGHTKLATTQMYAKVLDTKIKEDMSKLNEIFRSSED